MAPLDGISLAIMACSVAHGFWRGFTRLALGLSMWVLAFMAALRFHTVLMGVVGRYVSSPLVAQVVAFVLVLLGVVLAGGLVSAMIVRVIRATPLDGPDRLLGAAFGVVRGALFVVVGFLVAQWVLQPQDLQALVDGSRLTPYIQSGVAQVQPYLPDFDVKRVAPKPSTGHDASL
ncbi:CvpA family protein [Acetobacter sp. TBRC 12305]|uniref:CvpA family protein n=1 Tax=Acetobacter garciniae TaxID=2817435 RepID=A0A939HPZ4_9PROT|nr:CvpA family protein [Acetobacter garciniae]MBO1326099.1 CvpA family protein [Acetobacter garciniae]MBX0345156.1 CvpA family protein [Acetobacter garciniae]